MVKAEKLSMVSEGNPAPGIMVVSHRSAWASAKLTKGKSVDHDAEPTPAKGRNTNSCPRARNLAEPLKSHQPASKDQGVESKQKLHEWVLISLLKLEAASDEQASPATPLGTRLSSPNCWRICARLRCRTVGSTESGALFSWGNGTGGIGKSRKPHSSD